jgi:hypothetical protein
MKKPIYLYCDFETFNDLVIIGPFKNISEVRNFQSRMSKIHKGDWTGRDQFGEATVYSPNEWEKSA